MTTEEQTTRTITLNEADSKQIIADSLNKGKKKDFVTVDEISMSYNLNDNTFRFVVVHTVLNGTENSNNLKPIQDAN